MIADIIQIQKSTFANIRLTNLSQVAELNSVYIFILWGKAIPEPEPTLPEGP
mgnify:CR=1